MPEVIILNLPPPPPPPPPKKKKKKYTDLFVTTIPKLKLSTLANPTRSRLRYRGLYNRYVFTGINTKLPALYSYFSAPVLNNALFFDNGKILPLFVNQTIETYFVKPVGKYQFANGIYQ